jgi:hypothetical protein
VLLLFLSAFKSLSGRYSQRLRASPEEGPCKVEPSMGPISVKPEIKTCVNLCFVVHEDLLDFIFFSIK